MIEIEAATVQICTLSATNGGGVAISARQAHHVAGNNRMDENHSAGGETHQTDGATLVQHSFDNSDSSVDKAAILVKVARETQRETHTQDKPFSTAISCSEIPSRERAAQLILSAPASVTQSQVKLPPECFIQTKPRATA